MSELSTAKTPADKAKEALALAKVKGTMAGLTAQNISSILEAYSGQIAKAIPKHLTVERVIQNATTMISRNPQLAECTASSLIGAVMQASILGFPPVQELGLCWFVPFRNKKNGQTEVQFQIGYKGYIAMAFRSGQVKDIYAIPVYEKDEFEYNLGINRDIKHKPYSGQNRGPLVYVYAVAHFVNGGYALEVLDRFEVMKIKKASQGSDSKFSPWNTWEDRMWCKTAIKRLKTWLPLSIDIVNQMEADDSVIIADEHGEIIEAQKQYDNLVDVVDQETGEIKSSNDLYDQLSQMLKNVETEEEYHKIIEEVNERMTVLPEEDQDKLIQHASSVVEMLTEAKEEKEQKPKKAAPKKEKEEAIQDPQPDA